MSRGFHPRPKMSFTSALGVGTAGLDEVMDLKLAKQYTSAELTRRLRENTVAGIEILDIEILTGNTPKIKAESAWYAFPVPCELELAIQKNIRQFMTSETYWVTRAKKRQKINIRPHVLQLFLEQLQLRMQLEVSSEATVRPQDIIEILGLAELPHHGNFLTRTKIQLQNKKKETT